MRERLTYALLLLLAVEAAIGECFLVPVHPQGTAAAVAVAGNLLIGRAAGRVRRGGALGPGLCWLVVSVGLAMPGPQGDLIVPGTTSGVLFLVAGVVAAVAAAGRRGTQRTAAATPSGPTGR